MPAHLGSLDAISNNGQAAAGDQRQPLGGRSPSHPAPIAPSTSEPPRDVERTSLHSSDDTLGGHGDEESQVIPIGEEKPSQGKPAPGHEDDPFLVTMQGREDRLSPYKWKASYRWFLTALAGSMVLNATFASSAPANLLPSIIKHYQVSEEVGILLISIFVAGYCVGPLLWGPMSEIYGRRRVLILSFIPYTGFQVGCALSPNIGSLIVFRFLGGIFASSPLTASGGVISDIFGAEARGDALAIFALMPFAGPAMAPIVSGAMEVTGTSFRWMFWVLTIFAGLCTIALIILLPETYTPYILYLEAKRLRKETGDDRWHAAIEKKSESFNDLIGRTLYKPFRLLVQEPMLLVLSLYIYGLVYLLFEAVPIIFIEQHGFNYLEAGLVFLALLVGGTIAVLLYVFYFNKRYTAKHRALAGKPVPPEVRLEPMLYAAPGLAVAFFWVAWTSYPSISVASPILAIALTGGCVLFLFLSIFNYLIDTYLMNAASALAANTVLRSAFGAGFPLFAGQMYKKLGTPGASSLLGGLAALFIPAPFLFIKYGKRLRMLSKNAIVLDKD